MLGGIELSSILQGLRDRDSKKRECNPCPRPQPILTLDDRPPGGREGLWMEAQDICIGAARTS